MAPQKPGITRHLMITIARSYSHNSTSVMEVDYHTPNLVCKGCLCYRNDEDVNAPFRDNDDDGSTNEDEG